MRLIRRSAGVWGPTAFAGAAALAAGHQPGYSHRSHHVSGLAAAGERSALVMVPGFLALGVSSLLMPVPDPTVARLARVAGMTTIVAGLIPASQPRCPQPVTDPEATASDIGHGVASIVTFVLWAAMPIAASRHPGPRWYRSLSGALGIAAVAGLVAAGATTQAESPNRGLAQRGFLGTVFGWYIATAAIGR